MTLALHVYIFPENQNKVVERKTKMLHDLSYFYVTGFITLHFILRHIHSFKISIFQNKCCFFKLTVLFISYTMKLLTNQ